MHFLIKRWVTWTACGWHGFLDSTSIWDSRKFCRYTILITTVSFITVPLSWLFLFHFMELADISKFLCAEKNDNGQIKEQSQKRRDLQSSLKSQDTWVTRNRKMLLWDGDYFYLLSLSLSILLLLSLFLMNAMKILKKFLSILKASTLVIMYDYLSH